MERDVQVTIDVRLGRVIQGLSVPLTWDAAVLQPLGMSAGDLSRARAGRPCVVSPKPGTVDAALFGVRNQGVCGDGVLATVAFHVLQAGDPGLGVGEITARDAENHPVIVEGAVDGSSAAVTPHLSVLRENVPNPFNPSTKLMFATSRNGSVNVSIYTLRGRLVRQLVDGDLPAGEHEVTWDGTDGNGRQSASGSYVVRMVAPDRTQSRHITLVK